MPPCLSGKGVIRFGLTAVRGVGEKAVETIIVERAEGGPFRSLFDFCERVDTRSVQRSTIDALIRCGAFGSVHPLRAPALVALDRAFEVGQRAQDDKRTGQAALFGAPSESPSASAAGSESLPKVPEFEASELLKFEKELLGFYLSSHPLTDQAEVIERYTTATTKEAMNASEGTEVVIGAMICGIKPKVAKSGRSAGQKWAVLEFEDLEGKIEGMCFADVFDAIAKDDQQRGRTQPAIKAERIVFVKAKVDRRRETPCVIVTDLIPVEEAPSRLTTAVKLNLDPLRHTPEMLVSLKPIFQRHKGGCDVYAQLVVAGKGDEAAGSTASSLPPKKLTLRFDPALRVSPGPDFARDIESVLGTGALDLVGDGLKRLRRLEQQKLFTSADQPAEEVAVEAPGIMDAIDPDD